MSDHLPVLVLLAPLFGAIAIGLFGMRDHRVCLPVVLSALVLSLCCAIGIVLKVHAGGTLDYFVENTFNYPTLAEAYKIAALDAWNRMPQAMVEG